jgi:predicted PurR-regulated permease PerM
MSEKQDVLSDVSLRAEKWHNRTIHDSVISSGDSSSKLRQALQRQHLTTGTIRSVVQGILGIALIQALASVVLLSIFNVPLPGLWAMFVLILAVVQLPPLLILGPISIYVFSVLDTVPATVFTVFALLISMSDGFLKPFFLGRGVDIPMLVVLLGAIGGMLAFGILGLFVGAVVLALSYKLMMAWLNSDNSTF